MQRTLKQTWAWSAALALLTSVFMTEPAFAEMLWYDGRWIDSRHLASWQVENIKSANRVRGFTRLAMMIAATGLGFGIGWFCSPHAKTLRRMIAAIICIVIGLFALGNPTPWGWSAAALIALLGFCWGLGYWLGRGVQALFETPTTFGSSRWATQNDLEQADLFGDDGIIIGEAVQNAVKQVFSYKGDRHLLTVAPTRAWKGVSHIVPNLLRYDGSVLVIDVKAENCKITADARRAMGQRVIAVDPMGISGEKAARINPMDLVKLTDPEAPEQAMSLAESLVIQTGKATDPFWSAEAKAILQGLILHVAFDEEFEGERHLGTVRDLLLLPDDQMTALFEVMASSPHHVVASTGARSLQKDPKLISNVLASAQAETHMLDSMSLRDCMSASDFSFEDLKTDKVSIFIILPPDKLETFGRFEPHRVFRRLICLSYAAMSDLSRAA